jgi:anti-sigma factor RsiW
MICAYVEERISDYIEGALDAEETRAMDLHFDSCVECRHLLFGVQEVVRLAGHVHVVAPDWLPARILANTPPVMRETWADTLRAAWRWTTEPRTALAIFTATLVLGWLGGLMGLSSGSISRLRNPAIIVDRAEGALSGAYNAAVTAYYRSPLIGAIQCRIQQFRETSS